MHRAFSDLSSERPVGMAAGAIPRSAIRNYIAEEMDYLDDDAAEQAFDLLRAIDDRWLRMQSDKPEPERASSESSDDTEAGRVRHLLKDLAKRRQLSKNKRG